MPLQSARGAAAATGFGENLKQVAPITEPNIGDFYKGGYYFGMINIGADTYRLMVAPKAEGSIVAPMVTGGGGVVPDQTTNNGRFNTDTMAPISLCCATAKSLTINGFNDWYVASRDEAELLYRNLKATPDANFTGARANARGETGSTANGVNVNSVPPGDAYTTSVPGLTSVPLFRSGGAQAIEGASYDVFLASGVGAANWADGVPAALCQLSSNGQQTIAGPQTGFTTRVIRREKV